MVQGACEQLEESNHVRVHGQAFFNGPKHLVIHELEHAERVERLEDADLERAVRLRERGG